MKKRIIRILIFLFILSCVGCKSSKSETSNYLLCNDTSRDNMAEIESGFFYIFDTILYYADKEDMTKWVPVCNNADCTHKGSKCNAYVGFEIAQKGEKLYYVDNAIDNIQGDIFVNEISIDGSGSKRVYQIPFEDGISIYTYRALISSRSLILNYIYLTEDGLFKNNIARLNEDGTLYPMYSETKETQSGDLFLSSSTYGVRGEESIISSSLTLAYTDKVGADIQNVLWNMNGEQPKLINLPENVSVSWGYLSENSYIDYGEYENEKRYCKIDLTSGKKTFLGKPQQEDAWGYIMTEDCVVESNRYLNYAPEDVYLKIYYNEKWMNIPLPKVVTELEETSFYPLSIASDRIFFLQGATGSEGDGRRLYYVMLNDTNPELQYCTTFGSDSYFQLSNEPTENEEDKVEIQWQDLDITVFDTEEYLIKVTGVGMAPKREVDEDDIIKPQDRYMITMQCENKTPDKRFHFVLQDGSINGIYTFFEAGFFLNAGESKQHVFYISNRHSDIYDFYEYADIGFLIYDSSDESIQKIIHVYPQGEEDAISHVREHQSTDKVLIDDEYVTATIIGYDSHSITNDTAILFIENKSNKSIAWKRDRYPTINGIEAKQFYKDEELGTNIELAPMGNRHVLFPNCCTYVTMELPSIFLQENNVTSITSWEVILQFWYGESWDFGEESIKETFVLKP